VAGFCLIPAGVLWLCRKFSLLRKIGPVLLLYGLGIIIGNIGLMPGQMPAVQELLSNAMVPLAIPLMLFACTFDLKGARSQILALVTGLISVITAVVIGFLIFGRDIPEGAKVGGMLTGVYTGGTINLAALKTMLDVKEETYILINSYDILVSFLYLSFLLAIGIKLFRKFLPNTLGEFTAKDEADARISASMRIAPLLNLFLNFILNLKRGVRYRASAASYRCPFRQEGPVLRGSLSFCNPLLIRTYLRNP
jgi:uncharacterized membrane protein